MPSITADAVVPALARLAIHEPAHGYAPQNAAAIQTASIEAWPAAGGGLLVGVVVPRLHGDAPLRHPIKSAFIRIDRTGCVTVMVPYVRLENEAAICVATVIAAELFIFPARVAIGGGEHREPQAPPRPPIVDICPASELGLTILGATARTLMTIAAAEKWGGTIKNPFAKSASPTNAERMLSASYGELAVDAALMDLPCSVRLRSGLSIPLRDPGMTRRERSNQNTAQSA